MSKIADGYYYGLYDTPTTGGGTSRAGRLFVEINDDYEPAKPLDISAMDELESSLPRTQ